MSQPIPTIQGKSIEDLVNIIAANTLKKIKNKTKQNIA